MSACSVNALMPKQACMLYNTESLCNSQSTGRHKALSAPLGLCVVTVIYTVGPVHALFTAVMHGVGSVGDQVMKCV